jgi:signal transduction histidine kinase
MYINLLINLSKKNNKIIPPIVYIPITRGLYMSNSKILLLDDEISVLTNLETILSLLGYTNITKVQSGKEALSFIEKEYYDLVITDNQMPEMSGIDFIMKAKLLKRDINIIILTASNDAESLKSFLNIGVYKYLEKPLSLEILKTTLAEFDKYLADIKRKELTMDLGYNLSAITHEIANPLTVVLLRTQLLEQELTNHTPDEMKKVLTQLKSISNSARKIDSLIKDLKSQQNSETDLKTQDISLEEIKNDLIDYLLVYENSAIKFNIDFSSISPLFKFNFNKDQLVQILINLINNAADAITDIPEKWITINAGIISNKLSIKVQDSGLGIPLEYQSKIFDKTFSKKKKALGTGMGLYICKKILNNHNAQIYYDSTYANTTFIITF